jgi:O-antigen ligase
MPKIILVLLIVSVIIFNCLAYGGVTALAITITEGLIVFMLLLWLGSMIYKRNIIFVKTGLLLPIILFLSTIVFQILPLPLGLIRLLSGHTANLYRGLIPGDAGSRFFCLSIYPNATIAELLKFLSYIGVFFLIVNIVQTKRQFDFIINTIIFFGFFISIFGIIQKYTYSGKVYWFDSPGSAGSAFGPFVNRNNFSGYINMVIPLTLGYFFTDMPLAKRVIYGFFVVIMSLALFLSLSRAGILVYITALLFIVSFSRFKDSLKAEVRTLFIWILIVFSFFVFFMDAKDVWQRLITLFQKDTFVVFGHGYSWWDVLRIWHNFPIFGTGLGTFGNISSMYKSTLWQSLFTYAHNDFLQLFSETGVLGFIFISLFFIFYFKAVIKGWLKRHDSYVISMVLGGMASICTMLVYSILDFNLHMPANALLFFVIMGLVYSLVSTSFQHAR